MKLPSDGTTRAVVLVLHGGKAWSKQPSSPRHLSYRRMVPIAESVHQTVAAHGGAVWLVRNRYRGWNGPDADAATDARWAVAEARKAHPATPIVLVGHSMGGRAALRVAGADGVVAVCALAPWVEPGDPVGQLEDRTVLIAHGNRDRWTIPERSFRFAVQARRVTRRVARFEVAGVGHAMLRRSADWTGLVRAFVAGELGVTDRHPALVEAFRAAAPDGLRSPLPSGVW